MKLLLQTGSRFVEGLLVVGLATMAMLVYANVVLRYAFNSGISLSDELARFLFVWLTFLGAVAASWRGEHTRAEFLRARLGPSARRGLDIASEIVVAGVCCVLVDGAWRFTLLNLDNRAPISGLPMALVYSAGVLTGGMVLALTGARLWQLRSAASADRAQRAHQLAQATTTAGAPRGE